jgi:hypothetical protein
MSATPQELQAVMDQYLGGSDGRYRHPFNKRFIYTEGVKAMAESAGAYWLLDIVATEAAPLVMRDWEARSNPTGMLTIAVASNNTAVLSLSSADDEPAAWTRTIEYTDFPKGTWTFELAIDGLIAPVDVVVMLLLQEH